MKRRRQPGTTCGAAALLLCAAMTASTAGAQAPDEPRPDPPLGIEAGVPGEAVLPGEARGVAVSNERGDPVGIWLGRILLAGPRLAFMAVTEPIYQLVVLEDDYAITDRAEDFFFDDERVFGIYPVAFIETGFGLNAGLRLVHRDLFGGGENLKLRAGIGNELIYTLGASIDTGRRLPEGFRLALAGQAERQMDSTFYGFGDTELLPRDQGDLPQHAAFDRRVVPGHVRGRTASGEVVGVWQAEPRTSLRLTHRWRGRWVGERGEGRDLDEAFYLDSITGYRELYVDALTDLALHVRRTNTADVTLPPGLPSTGYRIDVSTGYQVGVAGDPHRFARSVVDLQTFLDLWGGLRVLRLRGRVESVLGRRDRVPFLDLPSLGGPNHLRGYPRNRFRGQTSVLGTVEYRYPVQTRVAAYLFVDVGRVFDDFAGEDQRHLRAGYGGGLLVFGPSAFLAGLQLASSIDGGFEAQFRLTTTDSVEDP